jgi:uncharacterized lipoprotein YddW (UPF0748 family)
VSWVKRAPVLLAIAGACGESTSPPDPELPRSDTVEARALWVSRFEYTTGSDILQILTDAKSANFNIVYLQVRGVADALYASDIEPCSARLCTKLGGTPAWDPLGLAVVEAKARGILLHAWINSFIGWTATSASTCAALVESDPGRPRHILLDHPDWKIHDATGTPQSCPHAEGNLWLSPGIPGVRTQLARVAADITRRYPDVGGIHLDFIRYPGTAWSYDAPSLSAFGKDPATNAAEWAQFRRDQVSAAVRETRDSVAAVRPSAVLSAAVWGIYDDKWNWSSSEGRDQYFQDPRAWMTAGTLDVAVPMIYWRIRPTYCEYTDWLCLVDDHRSGFQASGRHMYAGMYAPLGAEEMVRQIEAGRERGVKGFTIFSYGSAKSTNLFATLRNGVFRLPARIPEMSWK